MGTAADQYREAKQYFAITCAAQRGMGDGEALLDTAVRKLIAEGIERGRRGVPESVEGKRGMTVRTQTANEAAAEVLPEARHDGN